MSTRECIVAVIGLVQGPWVFTGRLPTPVLEIKGSDSHLVSVDLADGPSEDRCFKRVLVDCARQALEPATYMRVRYLEGTAALPICKIHSR
jgi:hypothetical protein